MTKFYWGRQGAGTLIFAEDTGRVLLLLRSEAVEDPGLWGIAGGRVEGESLREAALCETEEELGPVDIRVDEEPFHVWHAPEGTFSYYTFRAAVPTEFSPTLNWENDDFRWVVPSEAVADRGVHPNVRRALRAIAGTGRTRR